MHNRHFWLIKARKITVIWSGVQTSFYCFPLPLPVRKIDCAVKNSCVSQATVFCSNKSCSSFFPCNVFMKDLFCKPREEYSCDSSHIFIAGFWFVCCYPGKENMACARNLIVQFLAESLDIQVYPLCKQ